MGEVSRWGASFVPIGGRPTCQTLLDSWTYGNPSIQLNKYNQPFVHVQVQPNYQVRESFSDTAHHRSVQLRSTNMNIVVAGGLWLHSSRWHPLLDWAKKWTLLTIKLWVLKPWLMIIWWAVFLIPGSSEAFTSMHPGRPHMATGIMVLSN